MIKSNLIEDLSALQKEDITNLLLFLNSPYYSTKDDASKLLYYVARILEHSSKKEAAAELLKRECVFKEIFKEETFNSRRFSKVQHEAFCLLRKFIQIEMKRQEIAEEQDSNLSDIVHFFMSRGALKVAKRYVHQLKRFLKKDSSIGQENARKRLAAERAISGYLTAVSDVDEGANLLSALEALEHQYFSQRADLLLALLNLEQQHKLASKVDTKQHVATFFLYRDASWFQTEIGCLYVSAIQTMSGNAEEGQRSFEELLRLYLTFQNRIEPYERDRFETIIYNFCARHFQNPKYREHLLRFYQQKAKQVEKNAGTIHASNFISLVRLGIYTQDLSFVKRIAAQCRGRIYGPESSEMYYRLAQAHIDFEKTNYDESLYLLNGLYFEDLALQYIVRILEIKNAFELQAETLVESRLHALRMALSREKHMPAVKYRTFREFYGITSRLWRLHVTPKEKRRLSSIQKLNRDIQTHSNSVEVRWYRAKLKQLSPFLIHY